MSNYYVLSPDPLSSYMRIKLSRIPVRYSDAIRSGKPMKPSKSSPVCDLEKKRAKITDLVGGMIVEPIISERMLNAIATLPDAIEYYPVKLVLPKHTKIEYNYFALNALQYVDAFDRKNSKFKDVEYSPVVLRVTKLAIIESKIKGRNIFRLSSYPFLLIVSKVAREAFEAANLVGLQYTAIEDYKG